MTKETISETAALKALLSETADHQILAEMLGFVGRQVFTAKIGIRDTPVNGDTRCECQLAESKPLCRTW